MNYSVRFKFVVEDCWLCYSITIYYFVDCFKVGDYNTAENQLAHLGQNSLRLSLFFLAFSVLLATCLFDVRFFFATSKRFKCIMHWHEFGWDEFE